MAKKIRLRFVILTMVSVLIVLFSIIATIVCINYQKIAREADRIIDFLASSGGEFHPNDSDSRPSDSSIGKETPFETRYFTIYYHNDGEIEVNTKQIAAIDEEEALAMAETLKNKNANGYINGYRYGVKEIDDGTMVIFINWQRQITTAKHFMVTCFWISSFGYICVFILVFLLSKRVIKPMVEGYNKQKRFITNASHELKTPLTIISANNEIIELENGESDSTKSISKQISKLTQMINNLVTLAKLDENDLSKIDSDFSISEALYEINESFNDLANRTNKKVSLDVMDNIVYHGDESLIKQLLFILFDNAYKYSLSKISVSLAQANRIELTIKNDGLNIKNGQLKCYFERFYRSDEARASGIEGSGIGLSIAKEIVDLHKGIINVYGEDNMFIVTVIL